APDVQVVTTMARDQRLVGAPEIEPQPAPDPVEVALAEAALEETGRHHALAERHGELGTECQRVAAPEIAVPDVGIPVVGQIILEVDLVEEPRPDVITFSERVRGDHARCAARQAERLDDGRGGDGSGGRVTELDASDALERPALPIVSALGGDLRDVNTAEFIPMGVVGIEAQHPDRRIAPEQMAGNAAEHLVIEAARSPVDL